MYYGGVLAAPIIYLLCLTLSYYLYKELKSTYNEALLSGVAPGPAAPPSAAGGMFGGRGMGRGMGMAGAAAGNQQPGAPNNSNGNGIATANRGNQGRVGGHGGGGQFKTGEKTNSTSSNFKAFGGQGRKLGD